MDIDVDIETDTDRDTDMDTYTDTEIDIVRDVGIEIDGWRDREICRQIAVERADFSDFQEVSLPCALTLIPRVEA